MTVPLPARLVIAAVVLGGLLVGCSSRQRRGVSEVDDAPAPVAHEDTTVDVVLAEGRAPVKVRAEWTAREDVDQAPVVLFLPGGGNVSRRGTRTSDGTLPYADAVDVTRELATEVAERGWLALAWDKRTCGPRDTPLCSRYPTRDLDAEGPRALVKDVEAACAHALADPRSDGRLVLWAHGQAAQIALASSCAEKASAVVLVAPIPRRVDEVMVASLWTRAKAAEKAARKAKSPEARDLAVELKNRAASREAMFKAIEKGQFPEDARILGATLTFWKTWIELTGTLPGDAPALAQPWVVVLGARDTQYAPEDHKKIQALGALPGAAFVEVEGADHHLLAEGALDPARIAPILDLVHDALEGHPLEAPSSS